MVFTLIIKLSVLLGLKSNRKLVIVMTCPFLTKDSDKLKPCIASCELRVNNHCAIAILARKAILDLEAKKHYSNNSSTVENK